MSKRGQSILEYVLILTAVVAVIIWAAGSGGPFHPVANATTSTADNLLGGAANKTDGAFQSY